LPLCRLVDVSGDAGAVQLSCTVWHHTWSETRANKKARQKKCAIGHGTVASKVYRDGMGGILTGSHFAAASHLLLFKGLQLHQASCCAASRDSLETPCSDNLDRAWVAGSANNTPVARGSINIICTPGKCDGCLSPVFLLNGVGSSFFWSGKV